LPRHRSRVLHQHFGIALRGERRTNFLLALRDSNLIRVLPGSRGYWQTIPSSSEKDQTMIL
jgi:hypothetical protein